MKFPYGLSDFATLIGESYFYQDRTDRIPLLEDAGRQLIFIRPRRFGKSLLLSMLEHYYDVNRAGQFDALFGHLTIGQHPTPLRNQYFVMKWDFSLVKAQGEVKDMEAALHRHLNDCVQDFALRYQARLAHPIEIHADNALLYGEGLLKTVFKAVKAAAGGQGLDRAFITGVSPIVLSDMTSGYNVAKNIDLDDEFNDLCGFTEGELAAVLARLAPGGGRGFVVGRRGAGCHADVL